MEIKPDFAEPYYNLAAALAHRGQIAEAIALYRKALEIKPDLPEAHADLATALAGRGQVAEAMAHFQRALEIMPGSGGFRYNFGVALFQQGKIADAVVQWREAVRLLPNQVVFLNQLAWVLATYPEASIRNGADAVVLAERAVQLSEGQEPAILGTLAAAYAETGRFSRAIQAAERAIAIASARGDTALADVLRARIKLYQAGSPYHEALDQRHP
jgi:tetratricopeptide (TPR) repeat protein